MYLLFCIQIHIKTQNTASKRRYKRSRSLSSLCILLSSTYCFSRNTNTYKYLCSKYYYYYAHDIILLQVFMHARQALRTRKQESQNPFLEDHAIIRSQMSFSVIFTTELFFEVICLLTYTFFYKWSDMVNHTPNNLGPTNRRLLAKVSSPLPLFSWQRGRHSLKKSVP